MDDKIAIILHDIRNLLNSIKGYSDLIEEYITTQKSPANIQDYTKRTRTAIKKLAKNVEILADLL